MGTALADVTVALVLGPSYEAVVDIVVAYTVDLVAALTCPVEMVAYSQQTDCSSAETSVGLVEIVVDLEKTAVGLEEEMAVAGTVAEIEYLVVQADVVKV